MDDKLLADLKAVFFRIGDENFGLLLDQVLSIERVGQMIHHPNMAIT